jgi:ribosome-associated toxin RatA of RatAB toxin-antitoxin module
MASYSGSAEAHVAASPEQCFQAMVDYEQLPQWQRAVVDCRVLSRDDEGRGRRVRYEVDARVRKVSYTLDQEYDEPARIDSQYVEGDFKDFTGSWRFEPAGGSTHVTVTASIDAGVRLPAPVVRRVNDWVLSRSVEDLKRRVEASSPG